MRQIAQLKDEQMAKRFAAYLVTIGVSAHADADGSNWSIWVREEDEFARAQQELKDFLLAPHDEKYKDVERKAEQLERQQVQKRAEAKKRVVNVRNNWNKATQGRTPLVLSVIVICVIVFFVTDFGEGNNAQNSGMRALLFLDPVHETVGMPQSEKDSLEFRLTDIRKGEVWRLITPAFVHYGVMHIAMNMWVFWTLGRLIERRYGTVWLGFLIFVIAIPSSASGSLVPEAWQGSPYGAGFSGVIFGLFGYLWMKSTFDPNAGFRIPMASVVLIIAYFLVGVTGFFEAQFNIRLDNWAHGVGLACGMLIGLAPLLFKPSSR